MSAAFDANADPLNVHLHTAKIDIDQVDLKSAGLGFRYQSTIFVAGKNCLDAYGLVGFEGGIKPFSMRITASRFALSS